MLLCGGGRKGGSRGLHTEGGRDEEHLMLPPRPSLEVLQRSGRRNFHNIQRKPQAVSEWVISYFGDVVGGQRQHAGGRLALKQDIGFVMVVKGLAK